FLDPDCHSRWTTQKGAAHLVNVTSLFYLVPGVTAAMDWAFLGNPMSALMMGGLALVIVGLLIVFRYRAG
ncbi:hypothetical protein ACRSCP_00835, partial [Sphingomonas paucimobilis]